MGRFLRGSAKGKLDQRLDFHWRTSSECIEELAIISSTRGSFVFSQRRMSMTASGSTN